MTFTVYYMSQQNIHLGYWRLLLSSTVRTGPTKVLEKYSAKPVMSRGQEANVLEMEPRNPWDKKELGMFRAMKVKCLKKNDLMINQIERKFVASLLWDNFLLSYHLYYFNKILTGR